MPYVFQDTVKHWSPLVCLLTGCLMLLLTDYNLGECNIPLHTVHKVTEGFSHFHQYCTCYLSISQLHCSLLCVALNIYIWKFTNVSRCQDLLDGNCLALTTSILMVLRETETSLSSTKRMHGPRKNKWKKGGWRGIREWKKWTRAL